MKRHGRTDYFVVGEGIYSETVQDKKQLEKDPNSTAAVRKFQFSRMLKNQMGKDLPEALLQKVAEAMTKVNPQGDSDPGIPAGFTYLGQFIDHDLTMDVTAVQLGTDVSVADLLQGRSPALDLDSMYGCGPDHSSSAHMYVDGVRLKLGRTQATSFPDERTNIELEGFDLPRVGAGSEKSARRKAQIPDPRNDENLAVAQTHLAFMRFHNRVVDHLASQGVPSSLLFRRAKEVVVKHYQWMIWTDFLPRIIDPSIVQDVFRSGRRFFEVTPKPGDFPTMPIEFSVAAYRLGHSMIRQRYTWNRVFAPATLEQLFQFSGTAGNLSPDGDPRDPNSGSFERLPTNWIADFFRLFDFSPLGNPKFPHDPAKTNITKLIDTALVLPLSMLPARTFGGNPSAPVGIMHNHAFRNLTRAMMVDLATGQQAAAVMGISPLTDDQILRGNGACADLSGLSEAEKTEFLAHTPLWFYILREAELNGGKMTGVGGRITAETFHRATEGSRISFMRDAVWTPSLGRDGSPGTFEMTDLLHFMSGGNPERLNPLDAPPRL